MMNAAVSIYLNDANDKESEPPMSWTASFKLPAGFDAPVVTFCFTERLLQEDEFVFVFFFCWQLLL